MKDLNEKLNNEIKDYYNSGYIKLLKNTKKYKEFYYGPEALMAFLLSIVVSIIFIKIFKDIDNNKFNEMIRNVLMNLSIALIGMLGFIVGGLAILSGTIPNKIIKKIEKENKIKSLIGIFFSFYFIGSLIGISICGFLTMYLLTYIDLPINDKYVGTISFIFSYLFTFNIFYAIALLGTCIKIFMVNYRFSEE